METVGEKCLLTNWTVCFVVLHFNCAKMLSIQNWIQFDCILQYTYINMIQLHMFLRILGKIQTITKHRHENGNNNCLLFSHLDPVIEIVYLKYFLFFFFFVFLGISMECIWYLVLWCARYWMLGHTVCMMIH